MSKKSNHKKYSRKQFMRNAGGAIIGGSLLSSFGLPKMEGKNFKKPYNPVSKSQIAALSVAQRVAADPRDIPPPITRKTSDRKSTRLNSSHVAISYAVVCLKKQTAHTHTATTTYSQTN